MQSFGHSGLGGLEQKDREDGDERLQWVAESRLDGDGVVNDGLDEEDRSEEPRGGYAALEREQKPQDSGDA